MKKIVKKLMAIALVSAIVFSMSVVPASAAQGTDGQIIITNPSKDVAYSAYKIFDLSCSGDNYAYTIDSSSNFYNAVNTYAGKEGSDLTLTQVESSTTYNVKIGDDFSAAAFGDALGAVTNKGTAAVTGTATDTTQALTLGNNLAYGYYLVVGTKGETVESLVSLDSTNPTANIIEKNSTPGWHSEDPEDPDDPDDVKGKTIKIKEDGTDKYVETTNMKIGDTVTFAIKIDAKNYNGKNLITKYVIKDSMPAGFTFGSISSIKVGGEALASTAYTNNNFPTGSIEIPWATGSDADGWTSTYGPDTLIEIEYTATLNKQATIDGEGNTNKAIFTYEYGKTPENPDPDDPPTIPEDPKDWTDTDTDTATVYTYAIALKKINASGTALEGATFSLPTGIKVSEVTDKTNTYVVDEEGKITSITTSGTDASFTIIGVAAGEYEFTETAAPDGYNKLTAPVKVEAKQIGENATTTNTTFYVDEDGTITETSSTTTTEVTYTNNNYAVTPVAVVNLTGAELPSTGGMGTTIFYIIGGICVLGAAVLLITKRRMSVR